MKIKPTAIATGLLVVEAGIAVLGVFVHQGFVGTYTATSPTPPSKPGGRVSPWA